MVIPCFVISHSLLLILSSRSNCDIFETCFNLYLLISFFLVSGKDAFLPYKRDSRDSHQSQSPSILEHTRDRHFTLRQPSNYAELKGATKSHYETVSPGREYESLDALIHVPPSHVGTLRSAEPYASLSPVTSSSGGYAHITHGHTDALDHNASLDETGLGFNRPPPSLPGSYDTLRRHVDLESGHGFGFDSDLDGGYVDSLTLDIHTPGASMRRVQVDRYDEEVGEYEEGDCDT